MVREQRRAQALADGVTLLFHNPEVANRTCEDCCSWIWNDSGKTMGSEKASFRGEPIRRKPGETGPCWKCPKSRDKKTPNPNADLTVRTWKALQLFLEIRAGYPMPEDAIVRRNCGLIQRIQDEQDRGTGNLLALLATRR